MGSTGTNRAAGLTDLEYFTRQWPDALGEGGYWTVLAHNSTRDGFFAAIRDSRFADTTDEHFILVVKKTWYPRAAWENFIYKDMTDREGPVEKGASLAVLDAVPATDHEYAGPWRESCRQLRAQEAQIKRNLKDGATVKLPVKLTFSDDVKEDTFTARKDGNGRMAFRRASDGRGVRLGLGWKQMSGVVVTAPTA